MPILLLIFLLLLFSSILPRETLSQSIVPRFESMTKCVRRFYEEPGYFDPCKKAPCFIFLSEVPVRMPLSTISYKKAPIPIYLHSELFISSVHCAWQKHDIRKISAVIPVQRQEKFFPGLYGISLDILDQLPLDDALSRFRGSRMLFEGID